MWRPPKGCSDERVLGLIDRSNVRRVGWVAHGSIITWQIYHRRFSGRAPLLTCALWSFAKRCDISRNASALFSCNGVETIDAQSMKHYLQYVFILPIFTDMLWYEIIGLSSVFEGTDLYSVRCESAGRWRQVRSVSAGRNADGFSELCSRQTGLRAVGMLHFPPGDQIRLKTWRKHTYTPSSPSSVCLYQFGSLCIDPCWQPSNGFINHLRGSTWCVKRERQCENRCTW